MKRILTTAALTLFAAPALAQGTYPIFSGERADCVVWAVVPFPCHKGFDYQEPGGPTLEVELDEEELVEDEG